jgi:superfamily II DNA or RNA helicase
LQEAGKWVSAPTEALLPSHPKMQHVVETAYGCFDRTSRSKIDPKDLAVKSLEALKQAATLCTLQAENSGSRQKRLSAKATARESQAPKVSFESQFFAAETPGKFYLYDGSIKVLLSPASDASSSAKSSLRLLPALAASGAPLSPSKLISKLEQKSNVEQRSSISSSTRGGEITGHITTNSSAPRAPSAPPLTPEQLKQNLSLLPTNNPLHARRLIFTAATTYGVQNLRLKAATLAAVRAARNAGIVAAHSEAKKLWKAERAKAQRARLEALKFDDLEGYMRLVQSAKSSQIDSLLAQTDACLRQLAARLKTRSSNTTMATGAAPSSSANPNSSGKTPNQPKEGEGFSALKQSSENWNSLAAAFNADISQQPELLTGGELREYQMRGLRWMVSLRDNGMNGILADEMGLGKTVQVIALVCHCLATASFTGPFLIAAPASVLPNWENEFKRWAPSIKVVSYRGPAAERELKFKKEMKKLRGTGPGNSGVGPQYTFHVALTSYEYLMGNLDRLRLASISWSYIIIDEGHRLKNSGCKLNAELAHYRATNRLLLTGTPLQNGIDELWTLLNFLMPDLFSSAEDFQTWFGGAMRRNGTSGKGGGGKSAAGEDSADDSDAEDDAMHAAMLSEEEVLIVTSRLHQVLRPFMLRRLKEAVAGELPSKVEHLVPCAPSPYQAALFSALQDQLQGPNGVRGVSNTIMEMRNICNHPLISKLHQNGVEAALPRHPLPPEVRLCAKLEVLDRILLKLKVSGHRCLIFCTMTRLLDVLESYLEWRGLGYLRLDGSTSSNDRGALVDSFNAPDSPAFAFLLSVRAGGVGLNLQAADTVIFYDTDWNPQMDAQAAARAHRIGQKKDVLVLRMQTVGTVEERVAAVAADKRGMADRSITGGFFDGKTSAAERQKYLLGLLKDSGGGGSGSGSGAGGSRSSNLNDSELNSLLARTEEELKLFEKEDARLIASEKEAWQKSSSSNSNSTSPTTAAAAAAAYSRLASAEEVAPLVAAALAELNPPDPDEGKEFGKGKRSRTDKSYKI